MLLTILKISVSNLSKLIDFEFLKICQKKQEQFIEMSNLVNELISGDFEGFDLKQKALLVILYYYYHHYYLLTFLSYYINYFNYIN